MSAELARVNTGNCSLSNFPRVAAVFCQLKITVSHSLKYTNVYLGDTAGLSAGTEYLCQRWLLQVFPITFQ